MNLTISPKLKLIIGLSAALITAAALLFPGIGSFGFWEPHETDLADNAISYSAPSAKRSEPQKKDAAWGHLEERLVAISWKAFSNPESKIELYARVPIAILGLVAVAALFLLVSAISTTRIATFAAFALVLSPVFIFHSRQITAGLPILIGEILSIGGLVLIARGTRFSALVAGLICTMVGLCIGVSESGLLIGLAVPCATVSIALLMSGNEKDSRDDSLWNSSFRRLAVVIGGGLIALTGTAAFLAVALLSKSDIPLVTGISNSATIAKITFDHTLEQLAYGWFPWSAIATTALFGFFASKSPSADNAVPPLLRNLVISGLAVGYLSHSVFVSLIGSTPLFLAVPMTLSVAIVIEDLRQRKLPAVLVSLTIFLLVAIVIRDFVKEPVTILSGYGWDKISIPKSFELGLSQVIFVVPILVFVSFIGLTGSKGPFFERWRKRLFLPLMVTAGVFFAVYLSFRLTPDLSTHLSSKHAVESYQKFKKGDEPLGLFGPAKFVSQGEHLRTQDDVVDWLNTNKRVFALFPPKNFANINKLMRLRTGHSLFVLDSTSDRFYLATSSALPGEKDTNPITRFVKSSPFDLGSGNAVDINFDDKITMLGWDIRGPKNQKELVGGKTTTITTYWHCDAKVGKDYKIFMHFDGPGSRIHGDHELLDNNYSTTHWIPGDYIKDVHKQKIPVYQKKGTYRIRMGMYRGSKRLRIKDFPSARENAIPLTKVEVR